MGNVSFNPVTRQRLHEQIVEQIKEMIVRGEFKSGNRLPSEQELAKMLHVSKAPVRDALKMLEFMGVIEVRHGYGAVVVGMGAESVREIIDLVLESETDTLSDLIESRILLEAGAAVLACQRRTEGDLARMREAIADMEESIKEGRLGIDASFEFHMAMIRATKNKVLYRFMTFFSSLIKESRQILLNRPGRPEEAIAEHKEIFYAIEARDEKLADSLMRKHLNK